MSQSVKSVGADRSWVRVMVGVVLTLLTVLPIVVTIGIGFRRYHEFRSGYAWDLAYYNQWYWACCYGDQTLSIQPQAAYGTEGPSIWKMNYLSPLRYLLIPFYSIYPDPRTLIVIQAVLFWMVVPASYDLVRRESSSRGLALAAAALAPLTPLLWPLALNDFRELQIAIPFVVLLISGWRDRTVGLTALGMVGILACRQEFALLIASLAILPPREPEDLARTNSWGRWGILIGLGWFLYGFFGYLYAMLGSTAPQQFMGQFGGPRPTVLEELTSAARLIVLGLGVWALWAVAAPRVALIALPWIDTACHGRYSMDWIGIEMWHHVRYTAPAVATLLAAGLIGFARIGRGRPKIAAGIWILTLLGAIVAGKPLADQFQQMTSTIAAEDVEPIWSFIAQVAPRDGVYTAYEVSAPLSSRRHLYSDVLESNRPPANDEIRNKIRWMFLLPKNYRRDAFLDLGYVIVHDGPSIRILHRR